MEIQYKCLNNKLDHLQQKQSKHPKFLQQKEEHRFYRTVKNLTNIRFNEEKMQILKCDLNYSIERPMSAYAASLIAETEQAIRLLDMKMQNTYRIMATNKLKQIINSNSQKNMLHKRQLHVVKEIKKKLATENAILMRDDKGKTIMIINSEEYSEKVHNFLKDNNFNTLTKDPRDRFQKLIHKKNTRM